MNAYRFYLEFAPYWPLISPVGEYEEEAAYLTTLLQRASIPVHQVLELGSGGGHLAFYLRRSFAMTLTDLSEEMLRVSQALNPSSEHVAGDMRQLRLGRQFDAVLIHDAIGYMCSAEDLRAAMQTAFVHCRPGGVCVIAPDETVETFEPGTECGGSDGADGSGARYLEWSWDPDPTDNWVQTEYSFVFRSRDGLISTAHESHRTGLFSETRWLALLREVGFHPERTVEVTSEARTPRSIFVGYRPAQAVSGGER